MSLVITASTTKPASTQADLLLIPLYSDLDLGRTLPEALRRRLGIQMRKVDFKGEWGKAIFFPVPRGSKAPFVAIIGLGDKNASLAQQAEGMRRAVGVVAHDARKHMLRVLTMSLHSTASAPVLAEAATEGLLLAEYRFTDYAERLRKEQEARSIKKLIFLTTTPLVQAVRRQVQQAQQILQGVTLARTLVSQPASVMRPSDLVSQARAISEGSRNISVKILDREQADTQNWRGFLAVARGSQEEPYVIHLTYTPPKAVTKKIFIIGKGITFDSGGLSLKPAQYMEDMKIDMAGAAAVLGLFSIIDKLGLSVEVHGVIATCENMPSGNAYRPGDVITAKNGKTIEVLNTDAEGRITLADALSYAVEANPDAIIDLATLTGACVVALGEGIAGLWSNNEALKTALLAAGSITGEGLNPMPLPEEYQRFIQSQVADLRNIGTTRTGDAILAALFLQEFVTPEIPWAHLDIAGPAYMEHAFLPYYAPGATGFGVRTLAQYLKQQ